MTATNKKVVSINRMRAGGYDGASTSARAASWGATNEGPNSGLVTALNGLRGRARAAYRNHPYIFKAINQLTSDEIGSGIIPRSLSSVSDQLDPYWKMVSDNIDPEGLLDFSAMLAQISVGRRLAGEVFIRKRVRRGAAATSPLQLQVLESEYCPESMNEQRPNGNNVKAGIEFNKRGQRVAYWFYTEHPLDGRYSVTSNGYGRRRVRIPARDVIHHYRPTRAGQLRGEPDVTQSLVKTNTLEKYTDSEMLRKESKSSYSGVVTRNPAVFEADEDETTVSQGSMNVTPSSFIELLPGEDVNLFHGDDAGQGFDLFMDETLRAIAAGLEIPFELMSGNYSAINDRLLRGVMAPYRRRIRMDQQLTIKQVCRTVWSWALDAGVLSGKLSLSNYANNTAEYNDVEWSPEAFSYINPLQDVQARALEVEKGFKSRQQSIAERGGDAELVDNQRKEDQDREETLGLPATGQGKSAGDVTDAGDNSVSQPPSSKARP